MLKKTKPVIDCLAFTALEAESHMRRVSNGEFLEHLRAKIWNTLTTDQQELFQKLLASDRSRFVSIDNLHELASDTHETRYRRYKERVEHLSLACIDSLVAGRDVPKAKIKLIITNHTVGGVCPPLSSLIAHHLGLPWSVQTIDLAYMGCAAAVWGMELAARLLSPGEVGLILSSELTSVMSNFGGTTESLIASSVFGDGLGAFLVAVPPHRYPRKFQVRNFSGSLITTQQGLDCIRYEPNPVYHEIRLKETIPVVAGQGIEKALEPLVRESLLTLKQKAGYLFGRRTPKWQENIDYCILHCAGNRILKGIQEALELSDQQMRHNFEAFEKYGNTSSASIYYSLMELEKASRLSSGDRLLFLAYGSGFMTKGMYATVS